MHYGNELKDSKIECIFFPAPRHFKLPVLPSPPIDSTSLHIVFKQKQESKNSRQKREDGLYNDADETQSIQVCETGRVTFCRHFQYLGSYVAYYLRDNYDIEQRLAKASAAMGMMRDFWSDRSVDLYSRYLPCDPLQPVVMGM